MRSPSLHDTDLAASSWLHNCGPTPREVFRTPAIGTLVGFDLLRTLEDWDDWGASHSIRSLLAGAGTSIPPEVIGSAASRALQLLGAPLHPSVTAGDTPAETALVLLAQLAATLRASGTLGALVGIARHSNSNRGVPKLPRERGHPTLTMVATALVAYAFYSPPVFLWTRAPSLRWFRTDTIIEFRQFGGHGKVAS